MEDDSYHPQSAGYSLQVDNVQALAASINGSGEIPSRYIRPEAKSDPVVHDGEAAIPVVDLSKLLDPQCSMEEKAKLKYACEEWGFFQLVNHGISNQVIEKMKADVIEFFKLPLKEKQAFARLPGSLEGYGGTFVVSEDRKLDWSDLLYLAAQPIHMRNMKLWPTHPPTFRDTLDEYSLKLKEVAGCLMSVMADILEIDPAVISNMFKDQQQGLGMHYYPPCPKADQVLGVSPHTDATGLTLLLDVNDVPGLQIKKDGKWFSVNPLPGAFVVNIGDFLEILSNGKFRSIEHRALINNEKERLSIGAFHGPHHDSTVRPLPELIKEQKENYRTMSYKDYMQLFFSAKLDGRSFLESMKL